MKRKFIQILLTAFALISGLQGCDKNSVDPCEKEAGEINKKTGKQLKELYDIDTLGLGFGMSADPGIVDTLYIALSANELGDINQARKLILNVVDLYLSNIQANPNFIGKCAVEPFDLNNINMFIALNPNKAISNSTFLAGVGSAFGQIRFLIEKQENGKERGYMIRETLEEARKKVAEGTLDPLQLLDESAPQHTTALTLRLFIRNV